MRGTHPCWTTPGGYCVKYYKTILRNPKFRSFRWKNNFFLFIWRTWTKFLAYKNQCLTWKHIQSFSFLFWENPRTLHVNSIHMHSAVHKDSNQPYTWTVFTCTQQYTKTANLTRKQYAHALSTTQRPRTLHVNSIHIHSAVHKDREP